nr:uncharacterized protein LOC107127544 [Macaca fascicularis]
MVQSRWGLWSAVFSLRPIPSEPEASLCQQIHWCRDFPLSLLTSCSALACLLPGPAAQLALSPILDVLLLDPMPSMPLVYKFIFLGYFLQEHSRREQRRILQETEDTLFWDLEENLMKGLFPAVWTGLKEPTRDVEGPRCQPEWPETARVRKHWSCHLPGTQSLTGREGVEVEITWQLPLFAPWASPADEIQPKAREGHQCSWPAWVNP